TRPSWEMEGSPSPSTSVPSTARTRAGQLPVRGLSGITNAVSKVRVAASSATIGMDAAVSSEVSAASARVSSARVMSAAPNGSLTTARTYKVSPCTYCALVVVEGYGSAYTPTLSTLMTVVVSKLILLWPPLYW